MVAEDEIRVQLNAATINAVLDIVKDRQTLLFLLEHLEASIIYSRVISSKYPKAHTKRPANIASKVLSEALLEIYILYSCSSMA